MTKNCKHETVIDEVKNLVHQVYHSPKLAWLAVLGIWLWYNGQNLICLIGCHCNK